MFTLVSKSIEYPYSNSIAAIRIFKIKLNDGSRIIVRTAPTTGKFLDLTCSDPLAAFHPLSITSCDNVNISSIKAPLYDFINKLLMNNIPSTQKIYPAYVENLKNNLSNMLVLSVHTINGNRKTEVYVCRINDFVYKFYRNEFGGWLSIFRGEYKMEEKFFEWTTFEKYNNNIFFKGFKKVKETWDVSDPDYDAFKAYSSNRWKIESEMFKKEEFLF